MCTRVQRGDRLYSSTDVSRIRPAPQIVGVEGPYLVRDSPMMAMIRMLHTSCHAAIVVCLTSPHPREPGAEPL